MAVLQPYHHLQTAFTTGEISEEVANRVDLEKYQFALLKAKNCLIRPYGPVYKRPGLKYLAYTKNSDKQSILVPFNSGNNFDYVLEISDKNIRIYKYGVAIVDVGTPFTESDLGNLRFTQSADVMIITSGKYPVKQLARYSDTSWYFSNFVIDEQYFDSTLNIAEGTVTPSAKTGSITLTATQDVFTAGMVGGSMQIKQAVPSVTVKAENNTSSSLFVGDQWKIITGGTWTGTVKIEKSLDGSTWEEYRSYSGTNNFNPTETGTVAEYMYLRVVCNITSGTCTANLTALPYTHTGVVEITGFTDSKKVSAKVVKQLGATTATDDFAMGAWNDAFGYPKTSCFFQDRLCFGGSIKQPYVLWMSRTGDYGNFSVEKAGGTVTDDSAIAAHLASRKQFGIKHLVASNDLLILTEGNEWAISGADVVSPSNCAPKPQDTRGCGDCEPLVIGGKIVFVQGRGSTVRDMGYSFETDSYGGADLTILAKQIIDGVKIVDSAYKQEPDSIIYFVRSDGTIACLSYVVDQKVYAWSTIETEGFIEAVSVAQEGDEDVVYCIVRRTLNGVEKRCVECFNNNPKSLDPDKYVMVDCAAVINNTARATQFSVPHLAGMTVDVVADGRMYKDRQVSAEGLLVLPSSVERAVIGLPYIMQIELPNVEIRTGDGTMQGRYKQVSGGTLRLSNTLGGEIGLNFESMDRIQYDELTAVNHIQLFNGDKEYTPYSTYFNIEGRVCLSSDDPYPFNLLMITRQVTFGG